MTLRRWESWVTGLMGTQPFEVRLGRHFTKATAQIRIAHEPSVNTTIVLREWNERWPDERIHSHRWEVRRP